MYMLCMLRRLSCQQPDTVHSLHQLSRMYGCSYSCTYDSAESCTNACTHTSAYTSAYAGS